MKVGIIGLPNVGKSTIFNVLTKANATVAPYPFCTIEPNIGFVNVYDENVLKLSKIYDSKKITYASIKIVDVAGLVRGASKGEGLGNKFLSFIKDVDVLAHVIRGFTDDNISHITLELNALRDIEIINTELILSDIETLLKRKEKYLNLAKANDKEAIQNLELINLLIDKLNKIDPLENIKSLKNDSVFFKDILELKQKNPKLFEELNLLYIKPFIFLLNLSGSKKDESISEELGKIIGSNNLIKIYAKLELELLEIPENERIEFRKELNISNDGLLEFIKKSYNLLNLITFYTINENEARAWPLLKGSKVIEAAGKIHSDMQKGFIKAEVINCDKLLKISSIHQAREDGLIRIEGKDYVVQDKDVILIKFAL